MATNCAISFDQNEHGTYFTGQVLSGKVVLTLNKTKKFKGIKLQICGYAQCQWKQGHLSTKPIYKSQLKGKGIYYGREDYIASTTFLVGSEDGSSFPIEAGTHTYTFSCPIPIDCPSSFEGAYGHVRYMVKVTTIRQGSSNRSTSKGFTVLKLMDLNREPMLLKNPAYNEALENYCFFSSNTVKLRVDLAQTGYVPGQMILVTSKVINETSADVNKLMITLNLRATYTSDTPSMRTASEKIELLRTYCGTVQRHSERIYSEVIRVPATPPSCAHLSKVVRIYYEVCVTALMNHLMRNPKAVVPITIGNIPLMLPSAPVPEPRACDGPTTSTFAMQRDMAGDANVPSEESEEEHDMPPPTYEQAMFMSTNITEDDGNPETEQIHFTPHYPVYNVDEIVMNATAQSPPPNPPQKRKRRKPRPPQATPVMDEKPPRNAPEKETA